MQEELGYHIFSLAVPAGPAHDTKSDLSHGTLRPLFSVIQRREKLSKTFSIAFTFSINYSFPENKVISNIYGKILTYSA